jgi:hypothetical protein
MRAIHIVAGLWLAGLASTTLACDLPPLVAIPSKDKIGDQAAALRDATKAYFDQMKVYTDCVQAELTAAGGNSAPTLLKTVLIARNNAAVAEADAVRKLYDANLGPTVVPASEFNKDQKKK